MMDSFGLTGVGSMCREEVICDGTTGPSGLSRALRGEDEG
jgi:hypothetical protein